MSMNSFHSRGRRPRPAAGGPTPGPSGKGRHRADSLLVELGLAPSRSAARRFIEAGRVTADGEPVSKPAHELPDGVDLRLAPDEDDRYVSRGGLKLAGALRHTGLDPRGMRCLDVGQSTGGFTDCLLQAGAATVTGVEVGHGQLHARLEADPRVRCLEGLNARELTPQVLADAMPAGGFDLLACDASFISLSLLMPCWPALLRPGGQVVALVKPQFEVGPQGLGKGGIVRDASLYPQVETTIRAAARAAGLEVQDYFDSPITGTDGNREFFIPASAGRAGGAAGSIA